ncbi:unnamed protein product, partial [Brassica oleracea var. botrytis]
AAKKTGRLAETHGSTVMTDSLFSDMIHNHREENCW